MNRVAIKTFMYGLGINIRLFKNIFLGKYIGMIAESYG